MSRWMFLAISVGCGHTTPPAAQAPVGTTHAVAVDAAPSPPALEDDLPRLADRAVKFYADWQQVMAAVGSDCATATAKINALADANADFIAANAKVARQGHDKVVALRQALEPHATELDASAKAIVQAPAMAACHDNADFAHAIDRIQGDST
ncbi:MAG TPA: hypothetical protein VLT45_30895 [Kofleriaceae bacterium]|nr:hypothetical protein [Kofleriaceae bacterium]